LTCFFLIICIFAGGRECHGYAPECKRGAWKGIDTPYLILLKPWVGGFIRDMGQGNVSLATTPLPSLGRRVYDDPGRYKFMTYGKVLPFRFALIAGVSFHSYYDGPQTLIWDVVFMTIQGGTNS